MRRVLLTALFLALTVGGLETSAQTRRIGVANSSVVVQLNPITTVGTTTWVDVTAYGVTDHALTFIPDPAATTLTIALECSRDGDTSAGTIGLSTTTTGGTITGTGTCTHIRVNLSEFTGGTRIYPVWIGSSAVDGSPLLSALISRLDGLAAELRAPALPLPACNPVRRTNCQ